MRTKVGLFATTAVAASIFAGVFAGTAHAAAAADAPAATTTIEELVVTAEKREQNLQDVPVAISAFTNKQRDLVGINSIQDFTNFTPGFVYNSFNDRASVRGIGRLTNVHAVDAAVAIYIDGLYTTSTVLAGGPPLEVDRVEILRGPQGTLYGRNSIGGTVNIISARPTDHPYGEIRLIGENYGLTNVQVAASGPLTDGLNFRVSGYKLDQRDGYYTNVNKGMPSEGSKRNEFEYQFQLDAKLGENAELWMKYEALGWDNRGGPGARSQYLNGPYDTALLFTPAPIIYNAQFGYTNGIVPGSLIQNVGSTSTTNPALNDPHTFSTDTPLKNTLKDVHSFTTNFTYHFPTFDVKYIGGLQNYKYDLRGDADNSAVASYQIPLAAGSICGTDHTLFTFGLSKVDCSPLTVNAQNTYHYYEYPTWYSHEIDITSNTDSKLQWIAGLYYYHEDYSASVNSPDLFTPGSAQLQHPILGAAPNPTGSWVIGDYAMTTQSQAVFGQIDYKATDTLKFTLGLRYTEDHKFGKEFRRVTCFSDLCMSGLYKALGLGGFGPGTAANWGSLLGNLNALPAVGKAFGLGGALNGLAGLGNGAFDLTSVSGSTVPTTPGNSATVGAKGVTDPIVCTAAGVCTQGHVDPATGLYVRNLGDRSDAVTGTAGVQWDPEDGTMMYGRYSRGYKAFGLAAGSLLGKPEAAPEFVNSYEIGLKKNIGRTLQVNAAIYYLDYINLQAPVSVPLANGTNVTAFVNVAKSRSDGIELDAIWQPMQALRFMFDYSYDDTSIEKSDKFIDVNDNVVKVPVSVVGNALPNAPKNKVAVNGNYSFYLDAGTLTLGATYVWRDKQYGNVFTRDYNSSPTWDQIDLRANWASKDGKYQIIGYVKNVGDTKGYDAADAGTQTSMGTGATQVLELNPPRTYGVELHYKFY